VPSIWYLTVDYRLINHKRIWTTGPKTASSESGTLSDGKGDHADYYLDVTRFALVVACREGGGATHGTLTASTKAGHHIMGLAYVACLPTGQQLKASNSLQ
jgi:hypothetical protein